MACLGGDGYREAEQIRRDAVFTASIIRRVEAIAVALLNASDLVANYRLQRDISDRGLKISEEEQRHLSKTFWPRELEFLAEFGTAEDLETAETLGARYAGRLVSSVAGAFAKRLAQAKCEASRYCTSATAKVYQDLLLARAEAIANARILGRLIGFAEVQQRSDANYKRRQQAVAIGNGLIGHAARLYEQAAAGIADGAAFAASGLNSAITRFGMAKRDPGASAEMQAMWANRSQGANGAPYQPNGVDYSLNNTVRTANSNFLGDPVTSFTSVDQESVSESGVSYGLTSVRNRVRQAMPPLGTTGEKQMNEADVGNRDRIRNGEKTYTDYDTHGKAINITVKMTDFPVIFADHMEEGDS